jgi:hypothetical protein
VSSGLSVAWHDPGSADAPPGWAEFVAKHQLWPVWDWPIVHATAASSRVAVLVATVHDGPRLVALATARFPGLRAGRAAVPLAGVVDIDCLASGSTAGIALPGDAGLALRTEVVAGLRDALRGRYGRRVRALMFRQVDADWLPAVLGWPAVVRQGHPIAVFKNRFADFPQYTASLSRSRRWSLRKLVRELDADPDLSVAFTGRGDSPGPLSVGQVCALQAQVVDRHHQRWFLRKRLMQPRLARAELAHPQLHRLTYHERGRLLAYALVWDHPELPLAGTWGALAPADGGRDGLWFHFNAVLVRWCIETGRAGVTFGQGSAGEKRRLGYDLRRQWAVLVPQRPGRARR